MSERPRYIAVVGAGRCDTDLAQLAEDVGRGIARRGGVLVCGGLGGVMEAACRGARAESGRTIGFLPGTDRDAGNPHLELAFPTGLGEGRNLIIVRAADAVIAVGGEFGTLSEIAFALKLGRRVVGLRTWQLAREGKSVDAIVCADDAEGAVALAFER